MGLAGDGVCFSVLAVSMVCGSVEGFGVGLNVQSGFSRVAVCVV